MNLDFEKNYTLGLTPEELDARAQARRESSIRRNEKKKRTRRDFLIVGGILFSLVGVSEFTQQVAPRTANAIEQAKPGETSFSDLVRDADPGASAQTIKDNAKRLQNESGSSEPEPGSYYVVSYPEK